MQNGNMKKGVGPINMLVSSPSRKLKKKAFRYTIKSVFFLARRRRCARAKKLQNLAESDVDDWRSHCSNENLPSKCSSDRPPPQPLPLPELPLLLRHESDAVSNEPSVPLPSPTDAHSHHKTGEDSSNSDTRKDGVASHGRLSSKDALNKKKEHLGSRLSGRHLRSCMLLISL
ncbi:hypothetical protein HAX54_040219 [Datura stramonium]|uniref:Uncharacterized protein n=1 Tax=Datura stramonium TaxID=4076 RepID=A0ABS8SK29_DATST|nr:hypothetical protein [Datura stramonium]